MTDITPSVPHEPARFSVAAALPRSAHTARRRPHWRRVAAWHVSCRRGHASAHPSGRRDL